MEMKALTKRDIWKIFPGLCYHVWGKQRLTSVKFCLTL